MSDIKTEFEDEQEDEIVVRKPIEVAERVLALLAVIGKVHQGNDSKFTDWFNNNSIEKYLSHQETIFLNMDSPKQNTIRDFSWRAEALTSLLWGINMIERMPPLNQKFDVYSINGLSEIINDPNEFKNKIKLRTDSDLNNMEEELYNQHWRVRDAQLFGIFEKEMPAELDPSVVYERRYGMSWLVGWGDDWDHVPTDT
ncbi:DUF4272 domain-containing protein [Aquimarina sp. BL5]|uniref:DUF4272 domain-containing protein n=1 Tax=Aquimarina sp. BL5 TaxID=1714860 RepID=UPI000E547FCA|nr:DUF4272 domain-containing protein [Aquimarina sp. BL5]AXT52926.1 DUF4272 domain-containing protein [Aquimarina sp. BL5]RKM89795.1 DUF4272 domain-containing protein [Aquimarina sp. BL5]